MTDEKHPTPDERRGLSRRGFFTTAGVGAVGLAAVRAEAAPAPPADPGVPAGAKVPVRLTVNGREHHLMVEARTTLLQALREELGVTSAKPGCERGECGACTVLVDGVTRYACMTLALEAEGAAVTTLEGLMVGEELGPVQQAFVEHDAFQCGFCTPGQVMAVEGLLRANPDPSFDEVRLAVSGNLCRCGAYPNIFKAARHAADLKRAVDLERSAGGGKP